MLARAFLCVALVLCPVLPVAQAESISRVATGPIERGVGLFDGRRVAFEVIDGWAVVEGDIIIGRAAELSRALRQPVPRGLAKTFTVGYQSELWLKGASGMFEVPYTIAADPNGKVPPAIAAFNATFAGFLQFVPRTTQPDYVEFSLNLPPSAAACSSWLGRYGGKQPIVGPSDCPTGILLHEMGHAIGLLHEQNRADRDLYVSWLPQNVAKNARSQSALTTFDRKAVGPYDYGSIMGYADFDFSANGQPAYVTLPPGIEIGQVRGFSDADIDTVRRLYGAAPSSVTVTSAPPGLTVVVDGVNVVTPATFAWPIGSTHTIDVPAGPQTVASASYVFGRWNTDLTGDYLARRTIRVDAGSGAVGIPATSPAVTVYTANFVRVYAFNLVIAGDSAAAIAATTASVSPQPEAVPGLPGTYFRSKQLVTLSATTSGATTFGGWIGTNYARVNMGQSWPTVTAYPTPTNPAVAGWDLQAYASQAPTVRVRGVANDGVVDGFQMLIDNATAVRSPHSSALSSLASPVAHQVLAVSPQYRGGSTTKYTFNDWDGSLANPTSVTKPAAGQPSRDVIASFRSQHLVTIDQLMPCTGNVAIATPSADDFYDHGSNLNVTVTPSPGWKFTGWSDDLAGTATSQSIAVNGEVYATASYNLTSEPFAVSGTSRLFARAGEPASSVTVFGTGFLKSTSGQTFVLVNGVANAAKFVDANRMTVPLSAADLASPGEIQIVVANVDPSGSCFVFGLTGVSVQAAGYALPPTVDVVEFYNVGLDHYFITANADEMAKLDNGVFKGWARTGLGFKGFPADSRALAENMSRAVCRYYGNPAAGLDSHFYSAFKEECDDVKRKFPTSWVFESADVFQSVAPDRATGTCPDGTVAVYRLFNGRTDANHRYTTDAAVRAQMIAKGYVPEGYGPLGVALCAVG